MPYDSKAFGIVISRLRTEKELTQQAFAEAAQIARSHLTELENGNKIVRLDTFFRIAEALDLSPTELMRMVEMETLCRMR